MTILVWVLVGVAAGWLAGLVVGSNRFGLIGDLVLGVVGAAVAGWLLPTLGVSLGGGILGAILSAASGAILVLVVLRLVVR